MVAAKVAAEGFDDEVVVFALREAGDGDAADDACSGDVKGKAAAVGSVVSVGKTVFFGEGRFGLLEISADLVGAAMEASDDVGFSLDPAGVVWGSVGKGGVEEGLVGLAEAADIDDDGVVSSYRHIAEGEAEVPGDVVIEVREAELCLLADDCGDVFGDGHVRKIPE